MGTGSGAATRARREAGYGGACPRSIRISLPRAASDRRQAARQRQARRRAAAGRRGWPRARARAARRRRTVGGEAVAQAVGEPELSAAGELLAELLGDQGLPDLARGALAEHVGGVLGQHPLHEALENEGLELAEGIGAALAPLRGAGRRQRAGIGGACGRSCAGLAGKRRLPLGGVEPGLGERAHALQLLYRGAVLVRLRGQRHAKDDIGGRRDGHERAVMPGLVPGTPPTLGAGASGMVDPGAEPRGD